MFCTNNSAMNDRIGGSSCISCNKSIKNLYKNNKLICLMKIRVIQVEQLCYSYSTEIGGLFSAFKHAIQNKEYYRNKNIFISIDILSILLKLVADPINKY